MPGRAEAVDPEEEMPSSQEFLHQLPKKKHKVEEKALVIATLDNISKAQTHMSMATTNLSSLAEIMDAETFRMVLKVTVCPMVQLNIPPHYLDPVRDPKLKSVANQWAKKIESHLLPHEDSVALHREPKNNPTRLLAAVLWLKLKQWYLESRTAKEACEMFEVRAKMLSKILSGKKYLSGGGKMKGPKERLKKRKSRRSDTAVKKPEKDDDDDDDDQPPAPKESRSTIKGRPN